MSLIELIRLSGSAAVKAKNVHLSLVDQHSHLCGRGIVQLFTHLHPRRLLPSPYTGRTPPRLPVVGCSQAEEQLSLPLDYSPVGLLRQVETFSHFDHSGIHNSGGRGTSNQFALRRQRDLLWLATLALELFMPLQFRLLGAEARLEDRLSITDKILKCHRSEIPRFLRPFLKAVFDNETITDRGLPPPSAHQLLEPMVSLIPFPAEFSTILAIANKFRQLLDDTHSDFSTVAKMLSSVTSSACQTSSSIVLLIPYVKALLQKPTTAFASALHLLDPLAVVLGRHRTAKEFLPILVKLMAPEHPSPPLVLLYHKRFLLILLVRSLLHPSKDEGTKKKKKDVETL